MKLKEWPEFILWAFIYILAALTLKGLFVILKGKNNETTQTKN